MVDSPLRETAIVARVGLALGCTITICFITGLLCHLVFHPVPYLPIPTRPVWLTRVTQGLHIIAGIVLVPLTLVKLWLVYPKLFARPVLGSIRRALERLSIAVLVGSLIFQISTGMMFISLRLVVFDFFSFHPTHYTMSWVIVGAVCVHIAVKLDVITAAFGRAGRTSKRVATAVGGYARREVLALAGSGAVLASLMMVGQSVPAFRRISLFAPRSGDGPQGIPVNGTVSLHKIKVEVIADPAYQLEVVARDRVCQFTRQQLAEMRQHTWDLPIVCAEGWSRSGTWTGVPIRDLLARVGVEDDPEVLVESVQQGHHPMRLPSHSVADPMTLLALELNGEPLSYDHGYPFRIIAPNRIGVLQTKWVKRIEVLA